MIKQMTCIVCPVGCHVTIDQDLNVIGNQCPRGKNYALLEMKDPRRTLTTTVKTDDIAYPRLPVKSRSAIPKDLIFKAMEQLNDIILTNDVKIGDIIIENILDTRIDIIATKSLKK